MRVIAFRPKHNSEGKHDVTGAFAPECKRFMDVHGAHSNDIHVIDNHKSKVHQAKYVLDILDKYKGKDLDAVAFFCHGFKGAMQLGFNRKNVGKLADAIYAACECSNLCVPLYMCSAGGGESKGASSFADALRDSLCIAGATHCRIMAHTTAGHVTANPNVLFFDGMGSPVGGVGGYEVVSSGTTLRKHWVKALKGTPKKFKDFRFEFPFISVGAIHSMLTGTSHNPVPVVHTDVDMVFHVTDGCALIRNTPSKGNTTGKIIPVDTRVRVLKVKGDYVKTEGLNGKNYKWTLRSNLSSKPEEIVAAPTEEKPEKPTALLSPAEDMITVTDAKAMIRQPPAMKPTGATIPRYTRVKIVSELGDHVRVIGENGKDYQWTKKSNLTHFFKDRASLATVDLVPAKKLVQVSTWKSEQKKIAATYNRLGGLMDDLAGELGVHPSAVMAVWIVESGGRKHTPGKTLIRFEVQLLFKLWGKKNLSEFDSHFKFGGHHGVEGKPWKGHQYRAKQGGKFLDVHGGQDSEYSALALATKLAGEKVAVQCMSMGGPQILGSNYRSLGYRDPVEMTEAFSKSERAHVLGFFDFCASASKNGDMFKCLAQKKWVDFARRYNGAGKPEFYGKRIGAAYETAKKILN